MGYYTDFTLTMTPRPDSVSSEQMNATLNSVTGYTWNSPQPFRFQLEAKWYDCSEHIKIISALHPDILFELSGDGEEQGDQWHRYCRNGKTQICEAIIAFDPFDETKLK